MKKKYFILFLLLFACSKSKVTTYSQKNNNDSLLYYFNRYNKNNISEKDKKIFFDTSYKFILKSINNKKNRDSLFVISFKLYNNKDWENFDKVSKILLKRSFASHDSINLVKSYRYRAGYYKKNQVFDSAYYYYLKAEKIYFKTNQKLDYATILLNKSIVEYSASNFLEADISLAGAYNIFKDSDEKFKLYETLNQRGLVANILKEYKKSLKYHNEALDVVNEFKLDNEVHPKAICLNNIGYLYLKLFDYKSAIYNFEEALKNKQIINDDPDLYAFLIDNLAYSRLKSNKYKNLESQFLEALNIRIKLKEKSAIITSYIHLSDYYNSINNKELALNYSLICLKLSKESKVPTDIIAALNQASIVDDKNAKIYSQEYIRISDSLQIAERNSKDRFARIQLETEEIKKENVFLEAKNRDILNYFMGTMAIAGLLFFMRAQRAKSRELILKQAQQKANEDIYKLIISQQGKLDEGRIMEKTRIAKELHDGVLGRMFGLRLNLDGLNHRTDEEAVAERIRCLEELKIIEQDLREISHELSREKYVLINNFVAIVNNLLEEQTKINTAVLSSTIGEDIDWELLSNTTKINLYRILQESLQNINKYAQAKTIKVDLRKDKKGNLVLNIVDDGVGFETEKNSKGIGLKNIVTRTHESEGIIDIKSSKNKGTQIKVTVPLDNKSIKI